MLCFIALNVALMGLNGVSYLLLMMQQNQKNAVVQSKIRGR